MLFRSQKGNKVAKNLGPKRIEKEKAKELLEREVLKDWLPLINAQKDLALGHYELKRINGKKVTAYWIKPDGDAIERLVARVIGKLKEEMELVQKLLILDE